MSSRWPNNVRIIGGTWKNKRITVARGSSTRPTPVRARQVLFSWLQFEIHNMRVLDLFAGSGILGFEALSRGALIAHFVDNNHRVCSLLRQNCSELGLQSDHATVIKADALKWLAKQEAHWDLVFLDPPFQRLDWYIECLHTLKSRLASSGLVYVESSKRLQIDTSGYESVKFKEVGEVRIELLRPL